MEKRKQCSMYDYSSVVSHTHNIISMNYNSLALINCRCTMQLWAQRYSYTSP